MDSEKVDNEIRARLTANDLSALDMIWDHYATDLLGYLVSILCSRQDAEDTLQDVFVTIVRQRPSVANARLLKPYLFRLSRNVALNRIKKNRRIRDRDHEASHWLVLNGEGERRDERIQQVEELDGALKDFESMAPFVSALDGERLLLGEWAFNLQSADVRKAVFGDSGKSSIRSVIGWVLLSSPLSLYDHAAYLKMMHTYAKAATEPYSLEEAKRLEEQVMEFPWYNILTHMLVPALSATKARMLAMNADARITRAGLALLKYRQAKGAFPNDLRDLGMGNLLDPFTAKPLLYQMTPSGFTLDSVGENLVDDKGMASKNRHSGDRVWQYAEK